MSDLASQRRIAAAVLGCGVNRVWINPEKLSEVQSAMSREDIRNLIEEGAISSHQKKGISRGRARARIAKRAYGHCKGPGRRSGATHSVKDPVDQEDPCTAQRASCTA